MHEGDVITRACLFDDEYVFHTDGTFENILQDETWLPGDKSMISILDARW